MLTGLGGPVRNSGTINVWSQGNSWDGSLTTQSSSVFNVQANGLGQPRKFPVSKT